MIKYLIRMEPGIQTPEETLTHLSGSCRDTSWLLVQCAAPSGTGGAIRVGISDSAGAGCEVSLDGPSGTRQRISPICMPGRKCIFPARDGWGLIRPPACLAGEGHIPLACSADPLTAAAITGSSLWTMNRSSRPSRKTAPCTANGESDNDGRFRVFDDVHADSRRSARHQAVHRRAMGADRGAGPSGRCRSEGRRRAPDDGRRADVCLDR